MEINEDVRMCSFDIENINIPKLEVISIIESIIENDPDITKTNQNEIINIKISDGAKLLQIQPAMLQEN
jgi:hypothetical protein